MKAQDFTNKDSDRARVVDELIAACTELGLSYSYNEKQFKISLPHVNPISVLPKEVAGKKPRRSIKHFLSLRPDPKGYIEGEEPNLPDELPPTTTPLEDGEPPKGDDEA